MAMVQDLSVVGHGRRAGAPKERVLVLTQNEFNRLESSLTRREREEEQRVAAAQAKRAAFQKSKEISSKWENTLSGQRKAKLAAKKAREEEEERIKQLKDIEEEEYRAAERRRVIDDAKKKIFNESDRVKDFHGALSFTECLKEREIQIEHKKRYDEIMASRDRNWHLKAERELEQAAQLEAQRNIERLAKNQQAKRSLLDQMDSKKLAKESEDEQWILEGKELAEQAEEHKEKLRLEKEALLARKKEFEIGLATHLEVKKQLTKEEEAAAAREEQKRKIYGATKDKIAKMRAARLLELRKESQHARSRMAQKLAAEYKEAEDDLEERIEAARLEKEEKAAKREKEEASQRKARISSIDKHRELQLQVEKIAAEIQAKEAEEERVRLATLDSEFQKHEKEKFAARRTIKTKVATENLSKFEADKSAREAQEAKELEFEKVDVQKYKKEEATFQEYAEKVISAAEKAGRNTFPLKVIRARGPGGGRGPIDPITGMRPSYLAATADARQLPTYRNPETLEVRKNLEPGVASVGKQRLGFTW